MAAESPCRPPADLDLGMLESVIAARVQAAEDHILSLREDPAYYTRTLHELKDHVPDMVSWGDRGKDPLRKTENQLWCKVISRTISNAYTELGTWIDVHAQVKEIHRLQN